MDNNSPLPPRKSGQYPLPRKTTGSHQLPRQPSGAHQLPRQPSGFHPTAHPAHAHHPAPKKRADYSLYYILGIVFVVVGVLYFVYRDTWEQDNKAVIVEMKRDADALRTTQKSLALEKYTKLLKLVEGRKLTDPSLKYVVEDARSQRAAVVDELQHQPAGGAATPAATKAREVVYAKYESKSQPLLDALARIKYDAENDISKEKYKDDLGEVVVQYTKWFDAMDETENGHPSAHFFKLAKESFVTADSWWTIDLEKKMPDALFANVMKQSEWSKAAAAMSKIKTCMEAKDIVEKKACGACGGTGKIKCAICLGSGICQFCKGQTNPAVSCCDKGVCYACKGRKDSVCQMCNGSGEIPPK